MPPEETATAIDISTPQRKQAPVILKTKTLLPKPKQLNFKPKDAVKFFEWWKSFNPDQAARSDLKVYRKYPVIDQKLIGSKYKDRIDGVEGAIPFDPQEYEAYFLHAYGSGKYNLIMNEKGVPGIVSGVNFTVESEAYPPRIDIGALVRGHPENRGFEEGLRSRGVKFPGEIENTEEGGENVTVATQLADTLMRTNERLMDKVDEQQQNSAPDPVTEATSQAIGVIAEAAKASMQMTRDNASEISKAAAPQWNPMEILKQGIELSKGNGDGGTAMLSMVMEMQRGFMAQMMEMQRQNFEALRQSQTAVLAPPKSDLDILMEKAPQLKSVIELFGGGRRERSDDHAIPVAGKSWLQIAAENPDVLTAVNGVASSIAQIFMAWMSRPQPGAINPAAPQPSPDQLLRANGTGPQPVAKQPTPEELQRQAIVEQQTQFLKNIEKPLIAHFFDTERRGLSGYTFAELMQKQFQSHGEITPQGRLMYDTILSWQPVTLQKLCENYPDIYSVCGSNKVKWNQFFQEFSNYDQWYAEQERLSQVASGSPN